MTTRQATIDEPLMSVMGRVRTAAASQGWLITSGGSPQAPNVPMFFRRGLGSFKPADGLEVQLVALDANRTQVDVTAWRGSVLVDGYDTERLLKAIGAQPL